MASVDAIGGERRLELLSQSVVELTVAVAALTDELARITKLASDGDRLTAKEVAPLLGVTHPKTIEKWTRPMSRGGRGLPCVHDGRRLVFIRGDVLAWRAQQEK